MYGRFQQHLEGPSHKIGWCFLHRATVAADHEDHSITHSGKCRRLNKNGDAAGGCETSSNGPLMLRPLIVARQETDHSIWPNAENRVLLHQRNRLHQSGVHIDHAHVIDDDGHLQAFTVVQDVIEQCCLSRTEKAGHHLA